MGKVTFSMRIAVGMMTVLLILSAGSFCVRAAPEETEENREIPEEIYPEGPDDVFEGYSDEEIEQALEEFFGSDWNSDDLAAEAEILEDAPWTMTWEAEDGMFRYSFDEETFFLSAVPQGMVCAGPVRVAYPENGSAFIYKDGELMRDMDQDTFSEPGRYRLSIIAFSAPDTAGGSIKFYKKDFHFDITAETSDFPTVIPAPEGCRLREVRLDGRRLDQPDPGGIFLEGDGRYVITWEVPGTQAQLITEFTLDTTAPFLSFSQDVSGGSASIPLEFEPSEDDVKIYMEYNGFQGLFTGNTLWTEGDCRLIVEDSAGNRRSYRLHLEREPERKPVQWIVMGFVVLAGAAIWLFYLRRHMKII